LFALTALVNCRSERIKCFEKKEILEHQKRPGQVWTLNYLGSNLCCLDSSFVVLFGQVGPFSDDLAAQFYVVVTFQILRDLLQVVALLPGYEREFLEVDSPLVSYNLTNLSEVLLRLHPRYPGVEGRQSSGFGGGVLVSRSLDCLVLHDYLSPALDQRVQQGEIEYFLGLFLMLLANDGLLPKTKGAFESCELDLPSAVSVHGSLDAERSPSQH